MALSSALRDTSGDPLPVSLGFVALRDKISTSNTILEGARPHFLKGRDRLFVNQAGLEQAGSRDHQQQHGHEGNSK